MHEHSDEFRQALEDGDIVQLRRMWAELSPHLPQPKTDTAAETAMHNARTQANSVTFTKRAYSHRWLTERALPSGLPDELKPKAERMYPRVVEAVGIAVQSNTPGLANLLEKAMGDAVNECYADGMTDPIIVKARIDAARNRMLGSLAIPSRV